MKKVLIVDDSKFMRVVIRAILERNDFTVIGEAGDGNEAITKSKCSNPDIVILDITMPDMNGLKALEYIHMMNPNIKVVIVSALSQNSMIEEAYSWGAKGFIVKPFKEEEIIDVLAKIS